MKHPLTIEDHFMGFVGRVNDADGVYMVGFNRAKGQEEALDEIIQKANLASELMKLVDQFEGNKHPSFTVEEYGHKLKSLLHQSQRI